MKRIILLLIGLSILTASWAEDACAFYQNEEATWYGIDFTRVQLVGPDFSDPKAIKDRWFNSWNNLILSESDKYDLKSFFEKDSIHYNLTAVTERNKSVDENTLVTLNTRDVEPLSREDVDEIVAAFPFEEKEGYGILLVADILNKINEHGYYHLVFVDLSSKEILLAEKVSGKAGGFGFRNYWARTYYNALQEAEKKIPEWKKATCK